jgi:hypothetical protein
MADVIRKAAVQVMLQPAIRSAWGDLQQFLAHLGRKAVIDDVVCQVAKYRGRPGRKPNRAAFLGKAPADETIEEARAR